MTRVLIVVPRAHVPAATEALFELRILHVHDHVEGRDGLALGKPLEGASEASSMLIRLRAMIATLGITELTLDNPLPVDTVMSELEAKFDHLEHEIETLGENRTSLQSESRNIEQRLTSLEPFIALGLPLEHFQPYETLEVIVGNVTGNPWKVIERAKIPFELFRPKDPSKTGLFAMFVERDKVDAIRAIMGEFNFTPVVTYEGEGDPRAVRLHLKEGLAKVTSSLEEVELDLKTIRKVHGASLVAAEEQLSIQVEKAESPLRCGGTPNALFTEGWVPTKNMATLRSALDDAVGDMYHIEELAEQAPAHGEEVAVAADGGEPEEGDAGGQEEPVDIARETPVCLNNPEGIKVHEWLVKLVSTPRYGEIDPSVFMYFTFPIFFASMVGDIGYGIMFILLGFWLLNSKWKGVGIVTGIVRVRMTKMIMISGFVTILFGILYGEAFGIELFGRHGKLWPHMWYVPSLDMYLPINRLEEAMLMIKLCIYVGIAHILLGLSMGFANEAKSHGTLHAVLAKGSWFLILIGGFIVFKIFFSGDPVDMGDPQMMGGLIMLIAGILMLLAGEGMGGVLELPGIVSNVLSYTRLFAIGLSSLGIAMTFNNLGGMMAEGGGIGGILAGFTIAGLGHFINLLLALLAPSLHALRLHYVEWMTKFYAGGGTEYEPFGRERIYTEV
jgi:V/A-type H+-transporting ATPase subunit I